MVAYDTQYRRIENKVIPCPAHPTGRAHWYSIFKHYAILYHTPDKYAGIWECMATGESDTHEHNPIVEEVEDDPTGPLDDPKPYKIYVCEDDGVQLEGNPDADAQDYDESERDE